MTTRVIDENFVSLDHSKLIGTDPFIFDDNNIINGISTLALRQSSNENKAAYSTASTYVDVFQDASGITGLTNCSRDDSEYISTLVVSAADYTTDPASSGDRTGAGVVTLSSVGFFWTGASWTHNDFINGNKTTDKGYIAETASFDSSDWFQFDFGAGGKILQAIAHYNTASHQFAKVQASQDASTWTDLTGSIKFSKARNPGQAGSRAEDYVFASNETSYRYYRLLGTQYGSQGGYLTEIEFKIKGSTTNATGSFTSNNITASSSVSSMGGIITYQDQAGTNALNSDIVLKLSADGGSNYATATLTAMPDFATGIKMAKVNDLTVTAGTQLKYKLEFANQASGSKEARIRGVALQY